MPECRIALVNPPFLPGFSRSQRSPGVIKSGTMYYPFWLASAAGVLQEAGFSVLLLDAPAEGWGYDETIKRLVGFKPDLILLETSTPSIENDCRFAGLLKESLPGSSLGLAGTHVSALPEETLSMAPAVDWVICGEYDYALRDLAFCLQRNGSLAEVRGLFWRKNDALVRNPPARLIDNLDELPFLAKVYKEHLNVRNYRFTPAGYPMVMLITGRGCPNRCFFCVYPQVMHGRRYRAMSPERIVAEVDYVLHELPQVRWIVFEDDTFTADKDRVRSFCELILRRKLHFHWFCNMRVDTGLEDLRLMHRAGLRSVAVGFESGNPGSLEAMHKGITLQQSLDFARNARKVGITVHGCFMVGFPGETRESLEATFRFARKLRCDSAQFYPIFLYPGTEAYKWAAGKGLLKAKRFSQWLKADGSHRCVYDLPGLTAEELMAFCDRAYVRYHLRPGFIARKLFNVRKPWETARAFRYGTRFLFGQVRRFAARGLRRKDYETCNRHSCVQ